MRAIYLTAVWIHILAAATLIGGMVSFVLVFLPWSRQLDDNARRPALADFGRRFRVVTWTALAVLAVTGVFNLWARGVRLDDFLKHEWRATAFGHLVVVKIFLASVLVALVFAHDRARTPAGARWTGRLALLVVLLIVAAAIELVRGV